MKKLLEVIVTSRAEAQAAERGGADRLELVRDLHVGGLSPSVDVLNEVLGAVSIPVRVMLRETADFSAGNTAALSALAVRANELRAAGARAFVMGFVKDGRVDDQSLERTLRELPDCQATFHRAIEAVTDTPSAVRHLKRFPQIDRILTSGPPGDWDMKQQFLEELQSVATPEIIIVTGGGLDRSSLRRLATSERLNEFHVGTAARDETGVVTEERVSSLRRLLDTHDFQTNR
jgi:copper homeostasis protein